MKEAPLPPRIAECIQEKMTACRLLGDEPKPTNETSLPLNPRPVKENLENNRKIGNYFNLILRRFIPKTHTQGRKQAITTSSGLSSLE